MGTDGQAFNKVKNLLNRMDRSIDEARDKRLGRGPADGPLIGAAAAPAPSAAHPIASHPSTPHSSTTQTIGASAPGNGAYAPPRPAPASNPAPIGLGAPASDASKSGYGRAKPLSRPDAQPENARRWGA